MRNQNLFALLAAGFLMLGLLCVCSVGAFALFNGGNVPLAAPFESSSLEPSAALPASTPGAAFSTQPIDLPEDALAILRAEEEVLNRVYESVAPSVVNISVSGNTNSLLGDLGQGSGFVWDKEGHIVTNNHVVEGAETILVTFSDTTQLSAEVVGTDPDSDLAVIHVETNPEFLHPVGIGDSAGLRVGQRVIAIGNPFGFDRTLTIGVVSAVGRTVQGRANFSLPNLVQTDAAINPGNSGGPLLDIQGRVIGVNTLIYSQTPRANSGVGFAVPVDKVKSVVPHLISQGIYETPYLGIGALPFPLTPELAQTLALDNVTTGVLIEEAVPGGPAAHAGIRGGSQEVTVPGIERILITGGDVVVGIDGQPVRRFDDVVNYLDTRSVGDTITLTVIRGGEQMDIPVTLGPRPASVP
ncbi:MAG: trypsin-like peptidase domain-containing protein [Ardenticatenales bacterium]|nr:trypsin-like peptidase domain-containing protein [Ardenticatenales bacterium]